MYIRKLYNSLDPSPQLLSIDDFDLKVHGAGGNVLPYLGYIEADISLPFLTPTETDVVDYFPVLVTPDTDYNQKVPVLVGTNVIRFYGDRDNIVWMRQLRYPELGRQLLTQ